MDGGNLLARIKRKQHIDKMEALEVVRQILEALPYAHAFDPPILHKDIKPAADKVVLVFNLIGLQDQRIMVCYPYQPRGHEKRAHPTLSLHRRLILPGLFEILFFLLLKFIKKRR